MASASPNTRVLILGGGFAGVHTARSLRCYWKNATDSSITLISKENYFLMTPLLFEAGSGVLEPRHAVTPIRRMFNRVQFVQATVQNIDINGRSVEAQLTYGETRRFEFDQLVLALGGVTNTHVFPGAEKARTFKTLYDAITLRNHCIRLFERADVETDDKLKRASLTFVIVGGGLVGLELQGELTEFIKNIQVTYPHVDKKDIRFELIEGGPRLVPELDADLGDYAAKTLAKRGVNVRVNTRVDSMDDTTVRLPGGEEIEARTIVLATGVVPNPLVSTLPVEKDRKGRVAVEGTMRSRSHPNVWALGDCAAIPDAHGNPYPPLAQHALREAHLLGKNIAAVIRGTEPRPFVYNNKGTLAALGRHKGIGRVYGIKIYGFAAWWVWRTYYLLQMPRFDRKLRIVIDWTVSLFFKSDVVELDMTSRR